MNRNIIIFDTNTLFVDSKDKKYDVFEFRDSFKKIVNFINVNQFSNVEYYVSRITIDEIINQKVSQIEKMLNESRKFIEYFSLESPEAPIDITEKIEEVFKLYGFKTLENTINFERIYKKITTCEHPFRKCTHASDLGIKDVIILENILNFIKSEKVDGSIIFFTRDNDFDELKMKKEIQNFTQYNQLFLVRDEEKLKEKLIELNILDVINRSINSIDLLNFFSDQEIQAEEIVNSSKEIKDVSLDGVKKIVSEVKMKDGKVINLEYYFDYFNKEYFLDLEEDES